MLNCAALLILRQIHGNGIGPTGRRRMVDAAAAAPVAAAAAAAASPAIATAPAPAAGRRWAGSSSSSGGGGGGGGGGCSASGVISGTATWLFVSVCFQHYFPMATVPSSVRGRRGGFTSHQVKPPTTKRGSRKSTSHNSLRQR